MDFIRKSGWSFASVAIRGLGSLAINKIFALYFGTTGITLLSHFQNLIAIFTQIPADGINRGVINHWANPALSQQRKQEVLSSGILLTAICFTVIMTAVFVFRGIFINPFIQFISGGIFLIIVIFSVLAILANALVQSLILAEKRIKVYAWISIIGVGVLLGILAWAINYQLLEVAFIAYAIGNSLGLIFSLIYFRFYTKVRINLPEPTVDSIRDIMQFIVMALSVLVFGKLTDFFVRAYAMVWFGMTETGYWQSLVKLSDSYVMVFIGTVGVVFFPEISSRINNRAALVDYLGKVLWIIIPVLAVGLLVIFMLGEPLLHYLFSESFTPAYAYMPWQLGGDLFMLISYLFAYWVMARKKILWYVLLQMVSAVVFILTILIFKENHGVESILMGHLTRNIVFFAILLILIRKL